MPSSKAVRAALDKRIAANSRSGAAQAAKALRAKLEPPTLPNTGFEGESGTLASLETSTEASDSAPTAALTRTAAETAARSPPDWSAWQTLKTADLAQLNARLTASGLQQIVIPSEAELRVGPPEGGVDLP